MAEITVDTPGDAAPKPACREPLRNNKVMFSAQLQLVGDDLGQICRRGLHNLSAVFLQALGHQVKAALRIQISGPDIVARDILIAICIGGGCGANSVKDELAGVSCHFDSLPRTGSRSDHHCRNVWSGRPGRSRDSVQRDPRFGSLRIHPSLSVKNLRPNLPNHCAIRKRAALPNAKFAAFMPRYMGSVQRVPSLRSWSTT